LIVLLTSMTIYYLDLILGFGILSVKLWTPLQGRGTSKTTGFNCPPPHLVPRTLRHMRSCSAQGTLIVPLWRSAPFWPLLTTNGSHLAHFVEDWVDLLPLNTTFCMGRHSSGVFGRENLNFRVLAVRINFRSARFFLVLVFALAIKVGAVSRLCSSA